MIKLIVVLLFSFPSLASEEFGLVRNGPLRALRTTKPYGPFSIQKGTLLKKVKVEKGTITNGHEAFVYYSQESGKQIPGVFHMGNKNFKDNTEFIRFDFNDE